MLLLLLTVALLVPEVLSIDASPMDVGAVLLLTAVETR